MIDFRYHIVSIIAVFLALGIGVLVGSTVLDAATVSALDLQVRRLRSDLNGTNKQVTELRAARDEARALIEQSTPWTIVGRLEGKPVLLVYDGQTGRWRDTVRDGLQAAGATIVGSISLTDKWKLEVQGQADELGQIVRDTVGAFEPGPRPAEAALTAVGHALLEPAGDQLLLRLEQAKFVTLDPAQPPVAWLPRGTVVTAYASSFAKTSPAPGWLAALTRASAERAPTLTVSASPGDFSAVTLLREQGDLPPRLVTFDAGGSDYGRLGAVLALDAASLGRGGHYGAERGRRLVPEPAATPTPASSPARK